MHIARLNRPATTAHRPHCIPVAPPRLDNDEPPLVAVVVVVVVRRRVRVPRELPSRDWDASFLLSFFFFFSMPRRKFDSSPFHPILPLFYLPSNLSCSRTSRRRIRSDYPVLQSRVFERLVGDASSNGILVVIVASSRSFLRGVVVQTIVRCEHEPLHITCTHRESRSETGLHGREELWSSLSVSLSKGTIDCRQVTSKIG